MKPYQLIRELDCSKDLNADFALKFDAGIVKSEKYGEATLSGHFLLMYRHGEFPKVHLKQVEEKAYGWLKEIGLEEYQEYLCEKVHVPSMIAYSAPGVDVEKLKLYFQLTAVSFLFDDALLKLSHLNTNDLIKNQKDMLRVVESLISIVESKGDGKTAQVAASKNPTFEAVCLGLAYVCRQNYQQTDRDEYLIFARETVNYFRVNKWEQEFRAISYNENDFLFIRSINAGMYAVITQLYIAKNVRISEEIRMHPLLQKYYKNAVLHIALSNDVLSLRKEIADNEKENLVLVKCQKYSLQKAIYKTVKAINELMIDLKKDKIKLKAYFPTDHNLENFIKTVEGVVDGYFSWYQHSKRYGNIKFEKYVVEYDCDYNNWLEEIGISNVENMKEPVLKLL